MSDAPDELQRRRTAKARKETMSRADLAQLLAMAGDGRLEQGLSSVQGLLAVQDRPRHERRDETVRYVLRLELSEVTRPVVRDLELPSDLYLDEVSDIVLAAFGWAGYQLHRFAIGDPFGPGVEPYLCPFEVDDGEIGVDAREVRLDELLAEPGESCTYAYDYGDGWEVELRLREVRPVDPAEARVGCTGGEGAPPPEDCGGPCGYDELVVEGVTPDGGRFDADDFDPDETARDVALALGLRHGARPGERLERYRWLLDHVGGDGLPLTAAGHLKPADVRAAFDAWGLDEGWVGAGNRESWTYPVLDVRTGAMALELLRRYKGRLLLTRLGAQARRDPDVLRAQLALLVD